MATGWEQLRKLIMGTDPTKADTDGDGINDGTETRQGGDPNSGLFVSTGVIASADTPGDARDIAALNDLAVIADMDAGLAVFNIFNGLNPVLVAQVDTPGMARRVALSGRFAAVADDVAGLAIVDVGDPANARMAHQVGVGGRAQAVATAGTLALVGLGNGDLVTVDLLSGLVLERVPHAAEIHDIAVEGDLVYCQLLRELRVYQLFSDGSLEFLGASGPPTFQLAGTLDRLIRIFVGGGYAYVAVYPGYDVFDVRNPAAITKVATARDSGPNSFKQIVLNGAGRGVASVGPVPNDTPAHDAFLYDTSDPTKNDLLIANFPTPGATHAVSLYNGLAYAADGRSGLQVINFLARDTLGVAPGITLRASFSLNPPRAEEGKNVVVFADVSDDVRCGMWSSTWMASGRGPMGTIRLNSASRCRRSARREPRSSCGRKLRTRRGT
jgi:hypothetical protein